VKLSALSGRNRALWDRRVEGSGQHIRTKANHLAKVRTPGAKVMSRRISGETVKKQSKAILITGRGDL
jgi:hypothetical protein